MDLRMCAASISKAPLSSSNNIVEKTSRGKKRADFDVDLREVYFLILSFLSSGPCQKTSSVFWDEIVEHDLLPRRYHAWFSRNGARGGNDNNGGMSLPLSYNELVERYPHIEKDHLIKLLKQLLQREDEEDTPNAADVPTLLGSNSFSLLDSDRSTYKKPRCLPGHLRWPHIQTDQVHGLGLREIGGGFAKHHRAPSIRSTCYAVAKPLTMVQKMQTIKRLRGHRDAVYCAIFDRSGRHVITGSDDRLVKIWSTETAFLLASCRGHEGDITDLAVSSNNALVASASNDFTIRVWRLPDGYPISLLRGHTGSVTAIAFSPRPNAIYQLLSSSDDGTCRIWDARYSQCSLQVYAPRPSNDITGKNNGPSSSSSSQSNQILCCTYNANGTLFVTGSSDTYARVWSACKSSSDESDQPIHEIDVLSGHQNDVNYVQFSGCAVASRSSFFETLKEDSIPKFKNSWFCHDNIVTCSRDGSAMIWVPVLRRSHGKSLRWEKSFHLKVPPPPLPPQPPRGGPRQRMLPTPRGVNMIVWSLDNRFVLAAIMDCRICVWNASDSRLVHSLTGHTASSYVLDVHPFNPRIAMSAGYDGRTIVWDIWEGKPIHVYEIGLGRLKLVDGKFSPDGTSIVLSDDCGQIHFINTGQGDCQKEAKYDQFFLGDYRPLMRDSAGNTCDQETHLPPYLRNMQDPICDCSMIPYPEPYQTMFQKVRLGALGMEWRPSSLKCAVGLDFSLGVDYQMPPLEDLDRMIEPLPEFIDAIYWEPENEVISDDNDSEYNVMEECASEGEQGKCYSSASGPDHSMGDSDTEYSQKDGITRSRRRKQKMKIESSGKRVRKRNLTERNDSISGSNGTKKLKSGRKFSKRKSSNATSSRPQRVAARNALNMFPKMTEASTDEDEDEDDLEDDTSSSESGMLDSNIQSDITDRDLQNIEYDYTNKKNQLVLEADDIAKSPKVVESKANAENKTKIVLKLSLANSRKHVIPEDGIGNAERQVDHETPSQGPLQDTGIGLAIKYPASSSLDVFSADVSHKLTGNHITGLGNPKKVEDDIKRSAANNGSEIRWGEVKNRTFKPSRSDLLPGVPSAGVDVLYDAVKESSIDANGYEDQLQGYQDAAKNVVPGASSVAQSGSHNCRDFNAFDGNETARTSNSQEANESPPPKLAKIKIKRPSKFKSVPELNYLRGEDVDTASEVPSYYMRNKYLGIQRKGESSGKSIKESSYKNNLEHLDDAMEEYGSDAIRRTRSMNMKPTSTMKLKFKIDQQSVRTVSRKPSNPERKLSWLLLSKHEGGYRYIPQLGDEVVYLRQGHQEFLESRDSLGKGPWISTRKYIGAVEICKVETLKYDTGPAGDSCCKIKLNFVDPSSGVFGKSFELTLPELIDFPDFVVEKAWFDAAISRDWTRGDRCQVWWRNANGEGGNWWEGKVVSSRAKSEEYPDSPWERYIVRYDPEDEESRHCPWELHDPEMSWEHPHIDFEIRDKLMSSFDKLEASGIRQKDSHGIQKLNETSQKIDFFNRYPVPFCPEIIMSRLENDYYRTVEAVQHDIKVMMDNALSYFSRNTEVLHKMKRLSDWYSKKLSKILQTDQ